MQVEEQEIRRAREALRGARDTSALWLKEGKVRVGKGKGGPFGKWQEAGIGLIQYLARIWPDAKIALQLSRVQDWSICEGLALSPIVARRAYDLLLKGNPEMVFQEMNGQHLVVWVPKNNEDLSRIMGTLSKAAVGCLGRNMQCTFGVAI